MNSITISAVSKDASRVFITPNGDTTRGVWLPIGSSLEGLTFPESIGPAPKYRAALPGEGKGVKGGFSSLRGPR
jgi:hypothetical protein